MPIDVLYRPTWITRCILQWPVSHTLTNQPYRELLKAIRALPTGRFSGVIQGQNEETLALLFLFQSGVCGIRLNTGDLRGRDALAYVANNSERLTWTVRQAPAQFAGLVPIMASLVGEGDKDLIRKVGPMMSAHLEALTELEKSNTRFLLAEPTDAPDSEWLFFCTSPGHIHRFVVSADGVELPSVEGLGAETLMSLFRKQKTTDELYEAVARSYSDEVLAAPSVVGREPGRPDPRGATTRRSLGLVLYLLPVAAVIIVWAGWTIWGSGRKVEPVVAPPETGQSAQRESELTANRDEVRRLQEEISALRGRTRPSSAVTTPAQPSTSVRSDTRRKQGSDPRVDSLVQRIRTLETAIERADTRQAAPDQRQTQAISPDISSTAAPARPAAATAESPGATPRLTTEQPSAPTQPGEEASTGAKKLQARAYTETLVDVPPQIIVNPSPKYPLEARRRGIEGQVLVSVLVGRDGRVEQAISLRGRTELRSAATDGVREWRFRPAQLGGAAVPCWKTVTVSFTSE